MTNSPTFTGGLDWLNARLIMTLPMNGDPSFGCVKVFEKITDDRTTYVVTDVHGMINRLFDKHVKAFSHAFSLAAWPVRCREATEADYR